MAKTVWKVVRIQDDERYSAVIDPEEGGILYNHPGEPTLAPKDTRLLAFRTKEDASNFTLFSQHELWEAEAEDVQDESTLYTAFLGSKRKFTMFWRGTRFASKIQDAPRGTVSCSELTLIKKVR